MSARFQVMYGGTQLDALSVTMDAAVDQYAWRGTVELADEAQYRMVSLRGSVAVSVFGEVFRFIVDQKSYSASGTDKPSLSIGIISRAELYSTMQTDRVTGSLPALPRGVKLGDLCRLRLGQCKGVSSWQVGQISGLPVVWQVSGYTVPYASIKADNESGIGILTTLAETAGAKVRSDKSGTVYVYKVSTPGGAPMHTFDGVSDVLSIEVTESGVASPKIKAVRFRTSQAPVDVSVQAELATDMNASSFYPGDKVYLYVRADGDVDIDAATYGLYGGGDARLKGHVSRPYTYDLRDSVQQTLTPCEDAMTYITGDPVRTGKQRWEVWSVTLPADDVSTPYDVRVEFTADVPQEKQCITRQVGGSGVTVEIADDVVFGNETLMQRRVEAVRAESTMSALPEAVVTVPFRHGLDINQQVMVDLGDRSFSGVTQALRYTVDREKALCQLTVRGRWT